MSTPLTRVTISAEERTAELLLPSDQPIGTLLPRLGEILDTPNDAGHTETSATRETVERRALNLLGGPAISERESLRQAGVMDGSWLMLTSVEEALPEPIVYDVADVVEEELPAAQGASESAARDLVVAALGAVGILIAFSLFVRWAPHLVPAAVVALSAACWTAGALLRWENSRRSPVLTVLPFVIVAWGLFLDPGDAQRSVWVLAGTVLLTQLSRELSRRSWRGAVAVLTVAVIMAAVWVLSILLTTSLSDAAAVSGSAAILVLGLVPRWAIGVAGLNALDDRRTREHKVRRPSVAAALSVAHRSLQGTMLWLGGSVALGAVVISTREVNSWWDIPLLAVWAVVILLRIRHFPLAIQRVTLGTSGAVVFYALAGALVAAFGQSWWMLVASILAGLVAVVVLAKGPAQAAPHIAAQGRIQGDRIEFVAATAIIPLVVGHFGLYAALLGTFQN
ncbi:type VII secretion integral membrane protein EccD [Rothia koreensis]|jgi:type VII secretion integral membrane protein EccD|uniref:type VII secretion integral membrane protein EccD n=1 Tax=Rothia koreensis TaxID=592378 RepID=UPI0037C5A125